MYEIHTEIAESVTKPLDEIRFRQGYVQAMKDMLQMEFLEDLEEWHQRL